MKFDTIIIGGGLSGLVCGIRLSQKGQRCAIVSSGQSALHFSSGSFDLLNKLPDGSNVISPQSDISKLIEQVPIHPYAKLGEPKFTRLASEAQNFFNEIQIPVRGSLKENHYRITPMGTLKPTWLSVEGYASVNDKEKLPWKKVSIFNIIGFLDFYPRFIAEEFAKLGTESDIKLFNFEPIDHLRRNPSEMRSTNIARVLDQHINKLSQILNERSGDSDAIIFPACVGLDYSAVKRLKELVNKPILLIATMPPSIVGIYTQQYLHDYFVHMGGVYMLGDNILKADIENNNVKRVYSYNHGDIPFSGKNFVLATGSYFSQGLIATSERIYEPIFNLDVNYSSDRTKWYTDKLFDSHNYQHYGVKTDDMFRGLYKNKPIENLYVSGAILDGFNPVKEGSGAGVSILSALSIAETILSK
ncbi:glycerol-3-phosphate dehydrogenase subunit GlpB [Dysgonomonas sp. Marseille-P4361]|uniref:glycerol-3-phosphate dehydrogenase subunit GlpB n=1 Tax=Dysgonomonas sp. Marseille-P4361 TaxID=2161820 RepID=UPI000D553F1E|nr:glycerol-3-phosphate dehydrogenase subunit GlpB [Dysgonomonas sp. Marseille-P4361]